MGHHFSSIRCSRTRRAELRRLVSNQQPEPGAHHIGANGHFHSRGLFDTYTWDGTSTGPTRIGPLHEEVDEVERPAPMILPHLGGRARQGPKHLPHLLVPIKGADGSSSLPGRSTPDE
jgi:hypothetical protein